MISSTSINNTRGPHDYRASDFRLIFEFMILNNTRGPPRVYNATVPSTSACMRINYARPKTGCKTTTTAVQLPGADIDRTVISPHFNHRARPSYNVCAVPLTPFAGDNSQAPHDLNVFTFLHRPAVSGRTRRTTYLISAGGRTRRGNGRWSCD